MCPSFKMQICEIAGIEPERIHCADKRTCLMGEWEKCPVFVAQYFIVAGMAFDRVA